MIAPHTLLLPLLLAAGQPDPAAAKPGAAAEPESLAHDEYFDRVPPGTPAEVELWRRGKESINILHAVRQGSTRLQQRLKYQGTDRRLEALVQAAPGDARLADLKARLASAYGANIALLTDQWPVDPLRGCTAAHIDFEAQLWTVKREGRQARIDHVGKTLRSCLERLEAAVGAMGQRNKDLEAVIAEAEQVVAKAPPLTAGTPAAGEKK
jgi:hypothetical protein